MPEVREVSVFVSGGNRERDTHFHVLTGRQRERRQIRMAEAEPAA
jgi:hypothetical protein